MSWIPYSCGLKSYALHFHSSWLKEEPQLASFARPKHGFFKHGKSDNPPLLSIMNSREIAMDPWILLGASQSCFLTHRRVVPIVVKTYKNPIVVKHLHSSAGYILFIWLCLKIWSPTKTAIVIRKVATKQWMFFGAFIFVFDVFWGFLCLPLKIPWVFPLNNPWCFPSFPRVFHHFSVVRTDNKTLQVPVFDLLELTCRIAFQVATFGVHVAPGDLHGDMKMQGSG